MTDPLQDFGHDRSPYQQPHRDWQCGWTCEGRSCHIGPSSGGDCAAEEECRPFRTGDRFRCGRPREWGGPCEEGPRPDGACSNPTPPCRTRRTLRARRRRWAFLVAVAALGLGLMLAGGSTTVPSAVSPGPLAHAHRLLERNCAACHDAVGDTHPAAALSGAPGTGLTGRCLHCHDDLGPHATHPHDVSPEVLARATHRAASREPPSSPFALRFAPGVPTEADGGLACATCHDEHRGREHDLRTMTNQQCQVCHTNPFHGFADGHPEFGDYPHAARSNLYFDHARHLHEYFDSEAWPRSGRVTVRGCADCHELDPDAGTMRTLSFDRTCASCHAADIEDRAFPGLPFVAVPRLEAAATLGVGMWPTAHEPRPYGTLPPFMEWLLARDPEYRAAIAELGEFDVRELDVLAETQPDAVRRYARAIKRLFAEVARDGEAALVARAGGTEFEGDLPDRKSIAAVITIAQRRWFPGLPDERDPAENPAENPAEAAGGPPDVADPAAPIAAPPTAPVAAEPPLPGWSLGERDLSIRYRPNGHADPFLRDLVERTVGLRERAGPLGEFARILADPIGDGVQGRVGPVASGRCLLCHTVRSTADGGRTVNWRPAVESRSPAGFTRFRHDPHVGGTGLDCSGCHVVDDTRTPGSFRSQFFERDALSREWAAVHAGHGPSSGLQSIARRTCASCHSADGAKDDCLQCHRYHVGRDSYRGLERLGTLDSPALRRSVSTSTGDGPSDPGSSAPE